MNVKVIHGDCRTVLPTLAAGSVQCCVTSPPYFGLRDYGVAGQIGLEPTPDAYVAEMAAVFREVRRVLADDGTVWLNLGDSYAATAGSSGASMKSTLQTKPTAPKTAAQRDKGSWSRGMGDCKPKDLMMIPARVAMALQADGWWLRSDIIWAKPNPMPESVTDRPTSAHEHVFLLSKRERYFYDAEAVREAQTEGSLARFGGRASTRINPGSRVEGRSDYDPKRSGEHNLGCNPEGRNIRNVWTIATQPFSGAHFATMPPDLAERCIKAGSKLGDTILDPFGGAGTTGLVADRLGRNAVLIELNPTYGDIARNRVSNDAPLFAEVS